MILAKFVKILKMSIQIYQKFIHEKSNHPLS